MLVKEFESFSCSCFSLADMCRAFSALAVVEVEDVLPQCQGLFAIWEEKFISSTLCLSEILLWLS